MTMGRPTPHVTVAAVVRRGDGRFLLVEEETAEGLRWNQPAGHWEPGETLVEAAVRETREETGYDLAPEGLLAVYTWVDGGGIAWVRFTMTGSVSGDPAPEDGTIVRVLWKSVEEIRAERPRHRGPQVLQSVEDALERPIRPLDCLRPLF